MDSACIEWQGARSSTGYGSLTVNYRRLSAHRWAWEQAHGPIPDGIEVCHHCDNPPCINLDHLWLGTRVDNVRDMVNKGRAPFARLTEEQVLRIRASVELGSVLAERYGVSEGTISKIRHGQSWKHLAWIPPTQPRTTIPKERSRMAAVLVNRSVQFPDELNTALVKAAEERRVSVNWLIGQLCKEGLERLEPEVRVTA